MLISLMKTSMNKQRQTNENSSVKAVDYNEEGAEILLSSKTEDGRTEKQRKHFLRITLVLGPKQLHTKRDPLREIAPHRAEGRTPASLITTVVSCSLYY